MKYADKLSAKFSIVIGDDEIAKKSAILKNMSTGETKEISMTPDELCSKINEEVR